MNYDILKKLCDNPFQKINYLPLSPKEFFYFLFPGKLEGKFYIYDKSEYQLKYNILVREFGEHETEIIHSAGMALSFKYASKRELYSDPENCLRFIDEIYNEIIKLPIETITKPIGAGYTGLVFDYSSNQVIKLMYNSFIPNELKYLSFQKQERKVIFPEIIEYGNDYAIMEKVNTNTQRLSNFRQKIRKYIIQQPLGELSYREVNPIFKNNLPQDFEKYLSCIRREFFEMFGINSIGDLKDTNIGERFSSEELVFFDPIGALIKES